MNERMKEKRDGPTKGMKRRKRSLVSGSVMELPPWRWNLKEPSRSGDEVANHYPQYTHTYRHTYTHTYI